MFNILVQRWIAHQESGGVEPLPDRIDAVAEGLENKSVCAELVSGEPRNTFERIASFILGGRAGQSR